MSCFIVANAHISVLVNAAAQYELLDGKHPAEIGEMLLGENHASYAHRYWDGLTAEDRDALAERYVLETTEAPLHPYAVVRAAECYEYQSCEHPGWKGSAAHDFVNALIAAVERTLSDDEMTRVRSRFGEETERYHTSPVMEALPWEFGDLHDATVEHVSGLLP